MGVPCNARHAIEVGVVAGEVRQVVGLHRGEDEGVAGQQPGLAANRKLS